MRLIIIRGPSGSGKSTLANKIHNKLIDNKQYGEHYEADMWHRIDNEYKWKAEEQGKAHSWCQLCIEKAIRSKTNAYASVSNTLTTFKELRPYFEIAIKYNVPTEIFMPTTSWRENVDECAEKNLHFVPRNIIEEQLKRFYPLECKEYSPNELKELIKANDTSNTSLPARTGSARYRGLDKRQF